MNPYDKARELARAIEDSDVFKKFRENKAIVDQDEATKKMVEDFQKRQFDLEMKQMRGEELSHEDSEKMQELFRILSLNQKGSDYLTAQYQFSLMMQDISKILSEVIDK